MRTILSIVASIDKALRSDDEIQRLFALELIDRMPHGPWAPYPWGTLRRWFPGRCAGVF